MSGIGSTLRRHWVEVAWGAFAAANVAVIVLLSHWETIPFHFVWVSLTLVYGFRLWRLRTTMIVLLVVIVVDRRGPRRVDLARPRGARRARGGPADGGDVPRDGVARASGGRRRSRRPRRLAASEHRLLMGQREFVRDASHELRTPITVARGHAELIRDSGVDGQVSKDADVDPRRARAPVAALGAAPDPDHRRPSRLPVDRASSPSSRSSTA